MSNKNKYFIDVTKEICPITFVKVKIKIEAIPKESILEVKCKGKEAFDNIQKSAVINGYKVLSKFSQDNYEDSIISIKKN